MQIQQEFNRKERKEHKDKNLRCFFFAVFVFFVVNPSLMAACFIRVNPVRHPRFNSFAGIF
jgi:hypothetical protein